MEFKHDHNKFYLGESAEHPQAEITYRPAGQTIIVDHTIVSDELKGRGIAKQLVKVLADWARQEGLKIIPLCWYAKKELESNPDYQDLIA